MVRLSQLTLAPGEDRLAVQANVTLTSRNWLNAFQRALSSNDASTWNSLFAPDSWLKDNLVFRWDSATVEGASSIRDYIQRNGPKLSNLQLSKSRNFQPTLVERGPLVWIEAGFDFDTEIGSGRGIVRLANTKTGVWSAWIVYVALQELKSHPRKSLRSPDYFLASPKRVPDARAMEDEPSVLIIGGASAGLTVAAYLQDCGIRALVIEREQRVGDVWRKRYKTLRLHSPKHSNTRPFFSEPSSWPLFQTKDQFADYLESYASMLELDVWCGSSFKCAKYDDISGRWTVETLSADCRARTVRPKHVVWAGSAFFGPQPFFSGLPGYENFEGLSYHASEHHSASDIPGIKDKKVVVVGSKTTAHDICQDFVDAGAASVTMIQRSSTIVHTPEAAINILLKPPPEGMSINDSRFIQQSMPLRVQLEMVGLASSMMVQFDKQLLDGLDTTEFVASRCEDGDSFLRRSLGNRGGGYYVNHGASELIASGFITVAFCPKGVEKLTAHHVVLADSRAVEADVIVAATGFEQIEDHLTEVMGEKVASRATELHRTPDTTNGTSPDELERLWKGIYKPTGHPGFWMAVGNLQQTPPGAEALALQIVATEDGLLKA